MLSPTHGCSLFGALVIMAIAVPEACAQVDEAEHNCEKAAKIVARGKPDRKEDWAWSAILGCGTAGGLALHSAWETTRRSADTTELEAVFSRLWGFRDAALFASAKSILLDADAASESRIYSAILLWTAVSEDAYVTWAGITGGGGDGSRCSLAAVADRPSYAGTALPADARKQLATAARQAIADQRTPELVRRAARCVASEIVADDRARARPLSVPPGAGAW